VIAVVLSSLPGDLASIVITVPPPTTELKTNDPSLTVRFDIGSTLSGVMNVKTVLTGTAPNVHVVVGLAVKVVVPTVIGLAVFNAIANSLQLKRRR
jgi:phage-related minor tail protein